MTVPDSDRDRPETTVNGAGVGPYRPSSGTPSKGRSVALDGVRIPGKQPATIRRRIHAVYDQHPWLQPGDLNAVVRYVRIMDRFLRKVAYLDRLPPVKTDGLDVAERKLDAALRSDNTELSRLEHQLGLTARSRAELGLDVAKGLTLAELMSAPEGGS